MIEIKLPLVDVVDIASLSATINQFRRQVPSSDRAFRNWYERLSPAERRLFLYRIHAVAEMLEPLRHARVSVVAQVSGASESQERDTSGGRDVR